MSGRRHTDRRQGELIGDGRYGDAPSPQQLRVAAVKEAVSFSEAADLLELGVTIPAQGQIIRCDCPHCKAARGIAIREDDKGGRCTACGKGFDIVGLAVETKGCSFSEALKLLEGLAVPVADAAQGSLL